MEQNAKRIESLRQLRAGLTELVNAVLDAEIAACLGSEEPKQQQLELDMPLTGSYAVFKGRKPLAVRFPDGRTTEAVTWKKCVKAILCDASQNPTVRQTMLELRGKIFGRNRVLLSGTPEGMNAPIQFADDLYFESKFDTQTLLYVLADRVLAPCGYDASGIKIRVRL